MPVDISRTGYTGDLGYEIWTPWDRAVDVWDALMAGGRAFDIHPAGMLALDVARVEAGLLLIDVDFHGSRKALIDAQKYSPYEMGLGRLVSLDKRPFTGKAALAAEARRGPTRKIVGLEIDWPAVEKLYDPSASRRRSAPPPRASRSRSTATAIRSAARRRRRGRRC